MCLGCDVTTQKIDYRLANVSIYLPLHNVRNERVRKQFVVHWLLRTAKNTALHAFAQPPQQPQQGRHTIVLAQYTSNTSTRTFADFETVGQALDGK
jgi:hypothetical protein